MEAQVLSIQSHVVIGYVGNKSAIFPLQVLIVRDIYVKKGSWNSLKPNPLYLHLGFGFWSSLN